MQTFQRKLRFHKFVSEIIVGILVLTNVLAITPLASTTVALAQDSGVSFPTVKDLDWGKVYDDRTLRKENIDLDNMVELLENNTSSYVSELATKNQKLANWLKDNDNRSDFIKELQAYPGYDPDTPLTVMMLNEVTQAVIDSMIAQSCVTCSCNTVTGLHAYQVDLLDFILARLCTKTAH